MNKKFLLSFVSLMFVLSIALVAAWPFSITGNAIEGDSFEDTIECADSDGGAFSGNPGVTILNKSRSKVLSKDRCIGRSYTKKILVDGKLTKIKIWKRIKEYHCQDGKKSYDKFDAEDLGAGYCVKESLEVKDGDGTKTIKNVGKWVAEESFCYQKNPTTVLDETGSRYTTKCIGNQFLQYFCDEDNKTVLNETTPCLNKCSVSQGGCFGTCSQETDVENNITVPGLLEVDGEVYKDVCTQKKQLRTGQQNHVKQFTCVDNKLKIIASKKCGYNQVCEDSEEGAYCKDLYESEGTSLTRKDVLTMIEENKPADDLITKQDVLDMLSGCESYNGGNSDLKGSEVCGIEKTCLFGIAHLGLTEYPDPLIRCNISPTNASIELGINQELIVDIDSSYLCCSVA